MLIGMRLNEIAELLGARIELPMDLTGVSSWESVELTDLAEDSRSVKPGTLFICRKGKRLDGHDYAEHAVGAGAQGLLVERLLSLAVPQIVVEDGHAAMNRISAPFYGEPSRKLTLAGITGTNGKTTTAYMLQSILSKHGPAGLIGTIEVLAGGGPVPGVRTAPQAPDLQRLLRKMVDSGFVSCAMEAASVGIEQGRMEGCDFDLCVFTNLSRDHLDDHGTMEAYYSAKRSLFETLFTKRGLINRDDPWGKRLLREVEIETVTYGFSHEADFAALDIETRAEGSRFRAAGPGLDTALIVNISATYNVYNALAAAAAAHLLGVPSEAIEEGLAELQGVPGRFQMIEEGQDFRVVVDYAHTPDGLAEVLRAAGDLAREAGGKLIAVFGCGGDRDPGKRPLMGKAAATFADLAVITSDNPRSEEPMAIIEEIERGVVEGPPRFGYRLVEDRAEAIRMAIHEARTADVVVIAGKGHETGQEFAGRTIPFDDRLVAAEALRNP